MIINLWEEKQYPPKVEAMNEAVISLLAEGRDLNSLRVSEITGRAGIGKGTAYEYFSSKAEIIATALEYDLAKQVARLVEVEDKAESFRDMLEKLMDWVAENFERKSVFTLAFQPDAGVKELSKELGPDQCILKSAMSVIYKMIEQALVIGEKEGSIRKMDHYFGSVAIVSQVMSFSLYLGNPGKGNVSFTEAKEFAVDSIIKMLN